MSSVWVFTGSGGDSGTHFPGGVFTTQEKAEEWISAHHLTGVLTEYPLDVGVYDWAVQQGLFKPKGDDQRTPEFIGRFSSAGQQHHHYEGGSRCV
jgi:hypothetical protein